MTVRTVQLPNDYEHNRPLLNVLPSELRDRLRLAVLVSSDEMGAATQGDVLRLADDDGPLCLLVLRTQPTYVMDNKGHVLRVPDYGSILRGSVPE